MCGALVGTLSNKKEFPTTTSSSEVADHREPRCYGVLQSFSQNRDPKEYATASSTHFHTALDVRGSADTGTALAAGGGRMRSCSGLALRMLSVISPRPLGAVRVNENRKRSMLLCKPVDDLVPPVGIPALRKVSLPHWLGVRSNAPVVNAMEAHPGKGCHHAIS